ncbi:MAG: hypothetical protein ABI972_07630 [Acidobacteriota bacterium]
MMPTDAHLNIAAFALSATGATLGIAGTLMQANAYYPFAAKQFVEHMVRVSKTLVTKGYGAAKEEMHVAVKLSEARGEDRARSLTGLYLVAVAFLLQLAGAGLALVAAL